MLIMLTPFSRFPTWIADGGPVAAWGSTHVGIVCRVVLPHDILRHAQTCRREFAVGRNWTKPQLLGQVLVAFGGGEEMRWATGYTVKTRIWASGEYLWRGGVPFAQTTKPVMAGNFRSIGISDRISIAIA